MKKTIAIGIIALQPDGGLLKRFAGEVGVLPGTTVMVPQDCWCVLVAGEQATAIFDVGPHELQLMQFNRNPSGLLYTVGKAPETFTWYPPGTPFRRDLTVKVANPLQFVTETVVKHAFDTTGAVATALREYIDAVVPPGQVLAAPETAQNAVAECLGQIGMALVDLVEQPAVAPEVPHQAPVVGQPTPPLPQGATKVGLPPPPPPRQAVASSPAVSQAVPPSPPRAAPPSPPRAAPPSPTRAAPPSPPQTMPPGAPQAMPPGAPQAVSPPGSQYPPPPPPQAMPGPVAPPGPGPVAGAGSTVASGLTLQLTQVWSSSTMELFGKGELTLRVRILGRPGAVFQALGPFSYDQTREFLSPDDWLGERHWQALPMEQLRFPGLLQDHFYRVYVLAEERDKGSVDALGTLEWELGLPRAGELEMGPTQGGKRGQYVKLKAQVF